MYQKDHKYFFPKWLKLVLLLFVGGILLFATMTFILRAKVKQRTTELRKLHDKLEKKVEEQTVELSKLNELLEQKIEERKQAEEALTKSETFLNATGKIAKVGGWEIDGKTKKVFWTKEIYNYCGSGWNH